MTHQNFCYVTLCNCHIEHTKLLWQSEEVTLRYFTKKHHFSTKKCNNIFGIDHMGYYFQIRLYNIIIQTASTCHMIIF